MVPLMRAGAVGALVLVAAACSQIPEPAPTDTTTGLPPIIETTPPDNPPPPPPATDPIVGPTKVPGELSFDFESFGGVPLGTHPRQYGAQLGLAEAACGDEVFPTVYEPDAGWEAHLLTNWDWALSPTELDVEAIKLTTTSGIPTEPLGPIGPFGIRLGTPLDDIEAEFPGTIEYSGVEPWDSPAGDNYQLRLIVLPSPDDTSNMIVTETEGHVVAMLWGKYTHVNPDNATPFCVS